MESSANNADKKARTPSLVVLLRRLRHLDQGILQQAVKNAFNVDLSGAGKDSTEFILSGPGFPTDLIQVQGSLLSVGSFAHPYFSNKEKMASQITDLRLRKAVMDHDACLSVTALRWPQGEDPYPTIGKLLAELVNGDGLAILAPALGRMHPWDSNLKAALRGGDPLEDVRKSSPESVIGVPRGDPLMVAAVTEARRRWPEFVAAFEQRGANQRFVVKARFREAEDCEYMWAEVESLENNEIFGRLGNKPLKLKQVHEGSRVRIQLEDLCDWIYSEGREVSGGFSLKAVKEAAKRQKESNDHC
jgi:uncharacterized protein YegJ (DUF2314 family)